METIIEFFDFNDKPSARGRKLPDNHMSVWFNKKYSGYQATISQNIQTDKPCVRIGKLGGDLCMVFTDKGIRLSKKAKNLTFQSKPFVELILGDLEGDKKRKVLTLKPINDDVYVLQLNDK